MNDLNTPDFPKIRWNEILKLMVTKGYSPTDFSRTAQNENLSKLYLITFNAAIPRTSASDLRKYFFFVRSSHYGMGGMTVGSFPQVIPPTEIDGVSVSGWDDILAIFSEWLEKMRTEIDEPDLWDMYQANAEQAQDEVERLLGIRDVRVPVSRDTPLSFAEHQQFLAVLNELSQLINSIHVDKRNDRQLSMQALESVSQASEKRPRSVLVRMLPQLGASAVYDLGKTGAGQVLDFIKAKVLPVLFG